MIGRTGPSPRRVAIWVTGLALAPTFVAQAQEHGRDEAAGASVPALLSAVELALLAGDADTAEQQLAAIAEREPDNPWRWFFQGRVHRLRERPYAAMSAYDRALARLDASGTDDPALRARIAQHRQRARRDVFSLKLTAGLYYDTNVSFTGTGGQDLGFVSGRPDGAWGVQASGNFSPIANAHERLTFQLRAADTWYSRIEEFDLQDYGGAVTYAHRLHPRWSADANYTGGLTLLQRQSYVAAHTFTFALNHHWEKSQDRLRPVRTRMHYALELRDFLFPTDPNLDLDGISHRVGLTHELALQWTDDLPPWDLAAGYEFGRVSTEGREFDHQAHRFFIRGRAPLVNPWQPDRYLILPDRPADVSFSVLWELDRYRHPSGFDSARRRRRDLITTYTWQLSQLLVSDPHRGDLSLVGIVSWSDSDANIRVRGGGAPFSYDKVVYGLQLAWSW
jgi:tetratricopeptide (TPR) repeat protein